MAKVSKWRMLYRFRPSPPRVRFWLRDHWYQCPKMTPRQRRPTAPTATPRTTWWASWASPEMGRATAKQRARQLVAGQVTRNKRKIIVNGVKVESFSLMSPTDLDLRVNRSFVVTKFIEIMSSEKSGHVSSTSYNYQEKVSGCQWSVPYLLAVLSHCTSIGPKLVIPECSDNVAEDGRVIARPGSVLGGGGGCQKMVKNGITKLHFSSPMCHFDSFCVYLQVIGTLSLLLDTDGSSLVAGNTIKLRCFQQLRVQRFCFALSPRTVRVEWPVPKRPEYAEWMCQMTCGRQTSNFDKGQPGKECLVLRTITASWSQSAFPQAQA